MGKAVIWYEPVDVETYLDTAESTYTEDSANGFELENLEDEDPSVTWRSTDINENRIVFDYGSAVRTYGVFVANHNIIINTPDTKFRWEAGTTNLTADAGDDITMPDNTDDEYRPNSHIRLETEYRYNCLELDKASGSYTEVGYIFVPTKEYQFDLDFGLSDAHLEHEFEPIMDMEDNSRTGFIEKSVHKIRNVFSFQMQPAMDDEQVRKFRKIQASDYVVFFPFGTSKQGYFGTINFGKMTGYVESNPDGIVRWKSDTIVFTEAVE